MKYLQVPDLDLTLSPLGIGFNRAGLRDESIDEEMLCAFADAGGTVIDTARVYMDWIPGEIGRNERVLGDILERTGLRNKLTIITKGGHPKFTTFDDDLHITRISRENMRTDIELSLKALRTDVIDVYMYHRDNTAMPVEELIDIMEDFRREGKIRYYACSNWSSERMRRADEYCRENGLRGLAVNEPFFNLATKYMNMAKDDTLVIADEEMLDYHRENPKNLLVPYYGTAGGYFNKIHDGNEAYKHMHYNTPENLRIAQHLETVMEKYGCTMTQAVLGFFKTRDFVCMPLYGPRTAAEAVEGLAAFDIPFEKEDYPF